MAASAASSSLARVLADLAVAGAGVVALAWAVAVLAALPGVSVLAALAAYGLVALPLGHWHRGWPLTPADRITLARAVPVALLAGLLPWNDVLAPTAWFLVAVAALALAADGLDGAVARRTGTATAAGARFDMELDAAFLLVLCAWLVALDRTDAWVLGIGLLRYLFLAAGVVWPRLQAPLPPSFRRRLVCALQGVVLVACLAPPMAGLAVPLAALALVLLIYSFGADVLWLSRRPAPTEREAHHA
ncbi:CDP-alcohol phosphatidyltransferase family protein [Spiribacter halobius]|uniref:CDP-alcohol phosphatidyltransferase n=1 Tax=Sediminicurvatus halobius TaxID=2182432 RepID=A0A2U2N5C8_9GAMM|nr:CDP-alcohol phosphatidyltransferase family protein [Spiribacter halobius]PWG64283.1 CDP-alcohol phosphatidyltransferase [Spiribacter halobius]UEX79379.1 CDP-alcohol phosphatidyltransferase family protein [Spiribacter halobius]